jgi:ABC-type transport system involved in cytochrome c biogenesis permease subunit
MPLADFRGEGRVKKVDHASKGAQVSIIPGVMSLAFALFTYGGLSATTWYVDGKIPVSGD